MSHLKLNIIISLFQSLIITFIILLCNNNTFSQQKSQHFKTGNTQYLSDSTSAYNSNKPQYHFPFKNPVKRKYYHDSKKLSRIKELKKEQKYEKLLPILEKYVKNFGIMNFYRDTPAMWQLGQLYEKFGKIKKAKALYRIVLKHHRGDIKKIRSYYDSITVDKEETWVPLDYYYEMVEYRKSIDTLRPPKGVLKNMGPEINSDKPDYGPAVSHDNSILLFTSKRNWNNMEERPNEDLFYAKKDGEQYYDTQPYDKLNTQFNEGSPCMSKDGNRIYFSRCNSPEVFGNCDIYTAERDENGGWKNIENLGHNVNSMAWDSQPSLSHGGDTLYFASDRMGGYGLSDIYFTYKKKGKWQPAQNLGPIINTRGNEVSPYYHNKYDVLYFSSNKQLVNFGDFDIYKARKLKGEWQEPKNIGPLVNGKGKEYYFTIDAKSEYLYYAKSKKEDIEDLDLYSFPLPMGAQPNAYTRFEGTVKDSASDKPLEGVISVIDLENGIEVAPKFLKEDGSFAFDLINNNRYKIIIQGDDFFSVEKELKLKGDTVIKFVTKLIDMDHSLVLDRIQFENGKWRILPEMHKSLNLVLKFMLDHPEYKIIISGHTDSDGDPAFNKKLSQNRADAIKEYIVEKGNVDPKRIKTIGYGSSKPLTKEKTEKDKRINRRVEFDVIKPGDEKYDNF